MIDACRERLVTRAEWRAIIWAAVPFVFYSGVDMAQIPARFAEVPRLGKPCSALEAVGLAESAMDRHDITVDEVLQGTLGDVVSAHGAFADHQVFVCGSPAMTRATIDRLTETGTPMENIRYDPW